MSMWQNFKATDHSFEKKFFGVIFLLAVVMALMAGAYKLFDHIPDVRKLFVDNRRGFIFFVIAYVVVWLGTFSSYMKTLGVYEAETQATIKVSVINVICWAVFWIAWSIYCAWLTLDQAPLSMRVTLTIIVLVTVPALIAFLSSRKLRHDQLRDEAADKAKTGDRYEPYVLCLDRRYYSGYYALLCIPVYLLSLLVGHIIA